jgi:hypothetical protein
VEVLDLQVFDPVFLRLVMISQLDQLIIDILNGDFLIVLITTTLIIEAAILGITLDNLALDWLRNHGLQLLTIVSQDCLHQLQSFSQLLVLKLQLVIFSVFLLEISN